MPLLEEAARDATAARLRSHRHQSVVSVWACEEEEKAAVCKRANRCVRRSANRRNGRRDGPHGRGKWRQRQDRWRWAGRSANGGIGARFRPWPSINGVIGWRGPLGNGFNGEAAVTNGSN